MWKAKRKSVKSGAEAKLLFDLPPFQKQRWISQRHRVVYRSNNNANANGGVAYANTNNDSTNTNANIGSRLANNKERSVMPQRYSGVQHRGRVPNVEPVGMSLSNSVGNHGKLEKKAWGGVW